LQQVGVSEDSPLGKQALWTVAASPLGQLIFHDESRRLTTLGHLLSILPSTQTWVVCRNHQDANDLETQVRKFERKHRKRYQIPCGGVASRGLGSVHILPVSGIHKIPLERQNISSLRPKTGYGAVLPRLLIFWEAELACQKRVLKLCQHLNLDNTSRFLFSMSRNTGHQFDEMVVEQMCGPIVWHEAHGWFWPELGMESLSGG
jgi:hypothetical protein